MNILGAKAISDLPLATELTDDAVAIGMAGGKTCRFGAELLKGNAGEAGTTRSRILWRGGIFPGGNVEFTIPEECLHNNKTTVTLVIESYLRMDDDKPTLGTTAMIVPLSFGSPVDFGIDETEEGFFPYTDTYGYSIAAVYQNIHETAISYASSTLKMNIEAMKVVDGRYAVCKASVDEASDSGIIVTNISAYVPEEMEE